MSGDVDAPEEKSYQADAWSQIFKQPPQLL